MVDLYRRNLLKAGGLGLVYGIIKNFDVFVSNAYAHTEKRIVSDKEWRTYVGGITGGIDGGPLEREYGFYLTEKIFNKTIDVIWKSPLEKEYNILLKHDEIKKELYYGDEEHKVLFLGVALYPEKSTYIHPEEEKKVYDYFRKAFGIMIGKDPKWTIILPRENEVKYLLRGEKIPERIVKSYKELVNHKFVMSLYYTAIKSKNNPALGILIARTLVPRDIADPKKIDTEFFMNNIKFAFNKFNAPTPIHVIAEYVDFNKKEIKFPDLKKILPYMWRSKLKNDILRMSGKTIRFKSKEEMLEFLYVVRYDLGVIYGERDIYVPIVGVAKIEDKWKNKVLGYESYIHDITALSWEIEDIRFQRGRKLRII